MPWIVDSLFHCWLVSLAFASAALLTSGTAAAGAGVAGVLCQRGAGAGPLQRAIDKQTSLERRQIRLTRANLRSQ